MTPCMPSVIAQVLESAADKSLSLISIAITLATVVDRTKILWGQMGVILIFWIVLEVLPRVWSSDCSEPKILS
jgi:hypothetical protein